MNLDAENLTVRVNESEEVVLEPQYISYLRENGYIIEEVLETRAVPSESSKDKAYLVYLIKTYVKPRDHSEFDVVDDELHLSVCSCWSYRSNSADVAEVTKPHGSCKHTREAFMAERAQNDENQSEITGEYEQ